MNYLQSLVEVARASQTTIVIEATGQGLNVTVTTCRGIPTVTKSTNCWIDKSETDMVGRLQEHIKAVQ